MYVLLPSFLRLSTSASLQGLLVPAQRIQVSSGLGKTLLILCFLISTRAKRNSTLKFSTSSWRGGNCKQRVYIRSLIIFWLLSEVHYWKLTKLRVFPSCCKSQSTASPRGGINRVTSLNRNALQVEEFPHCLHYFGVLQDVFALCGYWYTHSRRTFNTQEYFFFSRLYHKRISWPFLS